jgi:class 3 adenylate cyclase/tetratricopeptide (TPR) repeat protein
VLFADIRNSTGLIATLDPEEAVRRVQPALDAMKDAVHRYDGIVNNVQGDGVMALFGAPRAHEDHAVRGCLAALAMQDAVARCRNPDLSIRVGLHTGEVVVRASENSLHQTYDATGAAVHLAKRMEQMADGGGILLTADTLKEARQFLDVIPLGEQTVRGLATPVEVFQLSGLKRAPASERFRIGPRPSPFSGRERELASLEAELACTARGEARVVGVVGEAGLGKSRLCFEFAESCRRRGIRVLEARILAHGRATPFQPVVELLRDGFDIRPNDTEDLARRRIVDFFHSRDDFDEIVPVLLGFMGLSDPAYPIPKLDATARKMRLLNFVRRFLHSRPRDEVIVIVVEDLHWIDAPSEEFMEEIVDAIVGTKTLMLLNFRPGMAATWMQRSHYHQISLTPLESGEIGKVLCDLLGDDPSLALLSRNIAERALGNPFFLEELVHSLVERGDFEGDRGAYRFKGGSNVIPLPVSVQAVLSARIDRLPEPSRQILQTAAVIGRDVAVKILEQVTDLPSNELAQALSRLRQAELLYERPPFEQSLYAFRHPLIQEVAYESLLHQRRRKLHRAVARAMEVYFKDRWSEHSIAYHWKKVRELLLPLSPDPTVDSQRMVAAGQIMNFGWREGISPEDAKSYFEEAKKLALASGDMRANAFIHAAYGRILGASGSSDEYVDKIREAEAVAGTSIDASLRVTLKAVLCHALRLSGRMIDALAANTEALDHVGEIGKFDRQMLGFDIESWLIAMRGQTLVMLGRGDEARPYLDRVIEMDAASVDIIHHAIPSLAYVDLAWANGDIALAERHAERAFSMALKSGTPYLRVYAQACRGLSHIVAGRLDEAAKDLVDALGLARQQRVGLESEARMNADLANAYRLKGEFSSAISAATAAIRIATVRHTRFAECLARIVRAEALYASGGTCEGTDAKQELNRTEALVKETGIIILAPLIRAARAKFSLHQRCVGQFPTIGQMKV